MKDEFEPFVIRYRSDLVKNPIKVPSVVIGELQHRAKRPLPDKPEAQMQAQRALKLIKQYETEKILEIRGDQISQNAPKTTGAADHEIFRVVTMHIRTKPFIVLTFDGNLTEQLQTLKTQNNYAIEDLYVARINPDGQLRRNNTKAQHEEWLSNRQQPTGNNSQHFTDNYPSMRSKTSKHFSDNRFRIDQPIVPDQGIIIRTRQDIRVGSVLKTQSGQIITLGKELGKGGEGTIYALDDSKTVCKIYFQGKLTEGRKQKIKLMLTRKISDTQICYPQEAVYDTDGVFRGFTMPKAMGEQLGRHLFHPSFVKRQPQWNRTHSTQLALKILAKIEYLHRLNILIGDINPANILVVNENTVYFVDCDSYQIEGFPCPVGIPAFVAPEIQGKDYGSILRTKEHELFAVAVLLFQIFIPGRNPYACVGGAGVAENIKRGHFPYPLGERNADRVPEGYYKYAWSHLSRSMKEAFNQCFHATERGKSEFAIDKEKTIVLKLHNGRIGIADWIRMIKFYEQSLKRYGYLDNPVVDGFDLVIAPQNRRRITINGETAPYPFRTDGKTDAQADRERLLGEMIRNTDLSRVNREIESPAAYGGNNVRQATHASYTGGQSATPPRRQKTSQSSHKPSLSTATAHTPLVQNLPPPSLWKKIWKKFFG
ncbi:MAG: hypothetical protein LBI05_02505 [Planctomycetaceae bacterium]|nr:hypothetical protein [Planctomycetaceae bacterium]